MSIAKYSSAFKVVYVNLWVPLLAPSSIGYSYYIAYVDTFSKYTWIYFLKQKTDVEPSFKLFHSYVGTQFNAKIKIVHFEFGGEFRPFAKFLYHPGIIHRLTCPRISH